MFTKARPGELLEFETVWAKVDRLGVRMQP